MNKIIVHSRFLITCMGVLLVSLNLAVFLQAKSFRFVDFDDYIYIVQNSGIQQISKENIFRAFKTQYAANWHPVTWLSHMVDYHFFGMAPGGHHIVNVFIHSLNTLVLALLMLRLTGKPGCSFAISILFAVHPLHVESVAWVSERKDLLSALYGFLSIYLFSVYAQKKRRLVYFMSVVFFALSLMSKPMLVTLPFILLLLDYWPLERVSSCGRVSGLCRPAGIRELLVEKIPFFLLSLSSCVITFIVQKNGGAVSPLERVSFENRLINASESYLAYIYKSLWPHNLSVFYPYQNHETYLRFSFLFSIVFLACLTVFAVRVKKSPALLVGWLWFLGTLVPVIGLVQVGGQSMADRYMYVPMVGLSIMTVFGAADLLSRLRRGRESAIIVLFLVTLFFTMLSRRQTGYWKESITLFQRAIDVNPENYMAHTRLGVALSRQGNIPEALEHYREAVKIKPEYVTAHYDMAVDLKDSDRVSDAIKEFKTVLRLAPSYLAARMRLGDIYAGLGMYKDAEREYLKAERVKPDTPEVYNSLGIMYAGSGEIKKAEEVLRRGALMFPGHAVIRNNLGLVYYYGGKPVPAINELKAAVSLKESYPEALNNLGLAYIMKGSPETALGYFRKARRLKPGYPAALENIKKAELLLRR